ncbi:MAG: tetratricopeptide repeat protein [bacterium]|nr:tetratricopeptide repeat protein [bacterium]
MDAEKKKTLRPARRRASRHQRLRRTILALAAAALVAAVVGFLLYRASRPEVRRPGEDLEDITDNLSRGLPAEAPAPRFTDVTAAAGLDRFVTFEGARTSQLPEDLGSGLAWGDFDNDGDDDLFLVSAGGALDLPRERWAPSELYENRTGDDGAISFRRVEEFPETRISGMAAAWGDADGDGWLDLVVTGYGSLLFFRNREGRLEREDVLPDLEGYWAGATWGDFDNDRDLDLYVCGYVRYEPPSPSAEGRTTEQYGAAVPYTLNPASFEPERNLLLRNDGAGDDGAVTFTEVAALYGSSNPEGRSLTALWHDFDDDGRLDLYVANDISDNALYLNRGETFEDAGLRAFVADYRGAMGLTAGDWNRDGDDDLFITHWIAQENALYDSRLAALRAAADPGASVRLSFSDLAVPLGLGQIALQLVGWGTEFADFDGDGWLDLIVANGSTLEDDQTPKGLRPQSPLLLWNRQGESFHDLAAASEVLSPPHVSRGLALSDFDRDGDLDVAFFHRGEGVQLLRNDMQTGHWLQLRLRSRLTGGEPRGFGDGTTVVVSAGGVELRRSVTSASYLSQSSRTLHFGLGAAERAERVEVRWLAGEPQVFEGLDADALWELTEGDPAARRIAGVVAAATAAPTEPVDEKARLLEFWSTQRAAMDALKRDGDVDRAAGLLRRALELKPDHGDSRYYLASCLTYQGRTEDALAELDRLRRDVPMSHRAHKQWGVLRAMTAASPADLEAARSALERALEINPEETGSLLVLGEIALLEGDHAQADQRLEWACRTNHRAVGGFFLRGYLAWKRGDREAASEFLATAQAARGEDWKPEGTVAEGDVLGRMHREETPLAEYWAAWDGTQDPAVAYGPLDAHLAAGQS